MYESAGAVAVAPDGDVLFALIDSSQGTSSVRRYDSATGKTSQLFAVNGELDSLAVKADGAVVAGYPGWGPAGESVRVSQFDPKSGHEDVLFSQPTGLYGDGTADVAVAPDGDVLFALNEPGPSAPQTSVREIDAQTGKITTLFSATGLEDIAVAPAAPPVAVNDAYAVNEGTTLAVGAAAGVLKNDTDPAGGHLTAGRVSGPAHGTLVLRPDGSFRYTPRAGFTGTDTFTYEASDGSQNSSPATVTIRVNAVRPRA